MSEIIICPNCGQKNRIREDKKDVSKCGKCQTSLNTNRENRDTNKQVKIKKSTWIKNLVWLVILFVGIYLFTIYSSKENSSYPKEEDKKGRVVNKSPKEYTSIIDQMENPEKDEKIKAENKITTKPINNTSKKVLALSTKCAKYIVTIEELNIRDKPGKPSNVLGMVKKDDTVCVYKFSGKWGRTDKGWISGKYLSSVNVSSKSAKVSKKTNRANEEEIKNDFLKAKIK